MAFCVIDHDGEGFNSAAFCGKCITLERTEHTNAAPSNELEHSDDKRVTNVHFVVANLSQQTVRVRILSILFTLCTSHS